MPDQTTTSTGGSKAAAAPAQPKFTYTVYLRPYGAIPAPGINAPSVVTVQGDSCEAKNIGTSLYWSISGASSGGDWEWDTVAYITYMANPPAA